MSRGAPTSVTRPPPWWAWAALAVAPATTAVAIAAPWSPTSPATTALLVLGLGAVAVLVAADTRDRGVPPRAVLPATAVVLVVAVAVPPRRSQDLWAYAAYGSVVAEHHASPYVERPADYPADPLVQRMRPGWRHTRSVYGPAFTALSAGIVRASRARPLPTRLAFQGIAALAVAAALMLLWRRARAPSALLLAGLHPLVAVHVVNGGHNDALVATLLLAAALTAARRPALGGLLVGAAASVKLIALLPGAGLVWWVWRRRGRRPALGAGMEVFGVPAAGYLLAGGFTALRPLLASAGRLSRASVWNLAPDGPIDLGVLHVPVGLAAALVVVATATLLIGAAARDETPARALAAPLVAYVLLAAYVLPWYLVWALPLAALLGRRARTTQALLAVAALLLVAYQYAPGDDGGIVAGVLRAAVPATQSVELAGAAVLAVAAARQLMASAAPSSRMARPSNPPAPRPVGIDAGSDWTRAS